MRLFSLPYLVLKEVLDNLEINHLFFLSLCSKKTKNLIVQTEKCQFKKIDYIEYRSTGGGSVLVFRLNLISGEMTTFMYLFGATNDFTMHPFGFVKLNELGTPIDFLRCPADLTMCPGLQGIYNSADAQPIIETVLKHLLDLIGHHTKFRVNGRFPDANLVPRFRNIQMSYMSTGHVFETKDMEEFLARATSLECLSWITPLNWKCTPFKENSKLYELDTLHFMAESSVPTDVLKRFNGRHVFLYAPIYTTDVIQFLNAWKSGEKFQNLEVINMDNHNIDIAEIGNSVELKEVNTEVEYPFVRKYPEQLPYPSFRYSWELKSRVYIVRESDGHVATVMMEHNRVFMGVWNLTEQAFLDKFRGF